MNCDRIEDCLVLGAPLSGAAAEHLRTCADCRTVVEALQPEPVLPPEERLDSIRTLLTGALRPVRPLPSDAVLVLIALALFTAFSLLAAIPVGYTGFHHLSALERLVYYTAVALCAFLFSVCLVHEIIPASRRRVQPAWIVAFCLLALVSVTLALFPNHDLARFAKLGLPCLRLGILCAIAAVLLAYPLLRKGFAAAPVRAATVLGFFAGLAGVSVLALHCGIRNFAHILVWHLGAMLIAAAGAALLAFCRLRFKAAL